MREGSWYLLYRENLHRGFNTTKTWARAWRCELGLYVIKLLHSLCLGLRPTVRLTRHRATVCCLRSQARPFTCRAIQQNQSIGCDTHFKVNTVSETPSVTFSGFQENSHKVIKANGGGVVLLEILQHQISHEGGVSSLPVHSAHAFTGYKIDSLSRQDSLVRHPKAIRTLLCGWSLWAEPGGNQ